MGFTRATVAGLLVGAAMASPHYGYGNGTQYTTEVVTAYTTYCPAPTTLTYQDKTYTITEATTLTITDCPCTISHPLKPTYQPPKPVYTTEVVTKLTTYCPEPTTLTFNNKTYTVTEPTTLTVTDCPCTVTKSHTGPAPTGPAPVKPTGEAPVPVKPTGEAPVPVAPTGTGSTPETPAESGPAVVVNAAGRFAPAGLLAAIGAIALF
ncbi:hypothetical protein LRP88_03194 [Fusarium phalaenopsidis]|nr:hypothetical protein NCS56_00691600 [Fusarium sp. Ph1]